jgi:hypothetical protein
MISFVVEIVVINDGYWEAYSIDVFLGFIVEDELSNNVCNNSVDLLFTSSVDCIDEGVIDLEVRELLST